eukprot:jgi/Botrbrau1/17820/Bobra.0127s0065.1
MTTNMQADRKPCRRRKLGAVRLNKTSLELFTVLGQPSAQPADGEGVVVMQPCTTIAEPQDFLNNNCGPNIEQRCHSKTRQTHAQQHSLDNERCYEIDDSFWSMMNALKNITENRLQASAIGATVVDKGIDAVNAVKDLGKAAVDIAQSLDTAFEQLMGTLAPWKTAVLNESPVQGHSKRVQTPKPPKIATSICSEGPHTSETPGRFPNDITAQERNSARSICLESPLPVCSGRTKQDRNTDHSLQQGDPWAQMQQLQEDLRHYNKQCFNLATENKKLREEGAKTVDVLNEQVRAQVENLIAEKARLAQENARLLRENLGLQELLQYSINSHICGPDTDVAINSFTEYWETSSNEPGDEVNAHEPLRRTSQCVDDLTVSKSGQPTPPRTPTYHLLPARRTITPISL